MDVNDNLTQAEIMALVRLVDAGIKTVGVAMFAEGGGVLVDSALAKLQAMADANPEIIPAKEGQANGAASRNDLS